MDLNGKLIFIAGATGMVGAAITERLLREFPDARIRGLHYGVDPWAADERIEYVNADLRDAAECRRLSSGCDLAVMAAAATSGSGVLTSEPWKQVNDNLLMNASMLEAFHLSGIRRVVFISSATLYQEQAEPLAEDDLDLNNDPHPAHFGVGWVFRSLEKLCRFWHMHTGMAIMVARASNVFGPFARFDPGTSNFIPGLIRKAADHMDPFEVWGSPDVVRDVIYSADFARAIVLMLTRSDIPFDIVNVGSGEGITVGRVAELALKSANHAPEVIRYNRSRPTTIRARVLDCRKAQDLLKWRPEHSLEEGIALTTDWWVKNRDRWTR